MSDRTQTLSVDLPRPVVEALDRGIFELETQDSEDQALLKQARPLLRAALSQPDQGETPSLLLNAEDRERLEGIIGRYEECAASFDLRVAKASVAEDIAFLRYLASLEHRGQHG